MVHGIVSRSHDVRSRRIVGRLRLKLQRRPEGSACGVTRRRAVARHACRRRALTRHPQPGCRDARAADHLWVAGTGLHSTPDLGVGLEECSRRRPKISDVGTKDRKKTWLPRSHSKSVQFHARGTSKVNQWRKLGLLPVCLKDGWMVPSPRVGVQPSGTKPGSGDPHVARFDPTGPNKVPVALNRDLNFTHESGMVARDSSQSPEEMAWNPIPVGDWSAIPLAVIASPHRPRPGQRESCLQRLRTKRRQVNDSAPGGQPRSHFQQTTSR